MNGGFASTHVVPDDGLDAFTQPDATAAPTARLDPRLDVAELRRWGDWSEVACSNGWTCWVDARRLVPVASPPPPPAPAGPSPAGVGGAPQAIGSYAQAYQLARPAGRSPAGIAAAAAAAAPAGRPPIALTAIGAAVVVAGALLPWLTFPNTAAVGSPDVPLQFLIDIRTTARGPLDLAVVLVGAAVIALIATVRPGLGRIRRIAGWTAVVLPTIYVAQVQRMLSDFGEGAPSLISTVGIGVLVTAVGGLIVALAPDAPSSATGGPPPGMPPPPAPGSGWST